MLPERRHAEWLPGTQAPRMLGVAKVGLTAFCGSFLLLLGLLNLGGAWASDRFLFVAFGVLGVAYVVLFVGILLNIRRQKARIPLPESPAEVAQFPAVVILRREVGYGSDEGLVSFVDGWLLFSGRHSSFSVRPTDVRLPANPKTTSFEFDGPHGRHRALLRPLGKGLPEAWQEWRAEASAPEGSPILPPVAVPTGRRHYGVWVWYALFLFAMGALTLRVLPLMGIAEILVAFGVLGLDLRTRLAFRRIALGLPPRATPRTLPEPDAP